jgi:tellurite resistance protein TehA-like permease
MGVSMETLFKILVPILVTMFVIGAAGCVIVIPVVAYRLFSVLVEPDAPDEQ